VAGSGVEGSEEIPGPGVRRPEAGLCETCAFARVVVSARGSRFVLCRLSETDARFAKYPRLPVVECLGYEWAADVPQG
jgi:hypothetical protein